MTESGSTSSELEMLRQFVLNTPDYAIILLSPDGMVLSWNIGAQRITGFSKEEIITRPFADLWVSEGGVHTVSEELGRASAEGRSELENWLLTKDKTRVWVNTVITPARDASGNIVAFGVIARDLTERKKAEQALELARTQALETARLKSEFLANMSHEIRTPLNGVVGMSTLLLQSDLGPRERECAEIICDSAQTLTTVINDILDFSKIEAGKLTLEYVDYELVEIVENTAELFSDKAAQKNISLITYVDPLIPTKLHGDPSRIKQVLLNLLGNALKFTEKGQVTASVYMERVDTHEQVLRFRVADTGIGIPQSAQNQLFQPFSQADSSITRKFGGTGLGLSISKSVIEAMGGKIGVESNPGAGSTFWFTLPVHAPGGINFKPDYRTDLEGRRCLLVGTKDSGVELLANYLRSWHLQCHTIDGGMAALNSLRRGTAEVPFDVIMVDYLLPDMSSLALAKDICGMEESRRSQLILIANPSQISSGEAAKAAGYSAFLTKPVRQSQLFNCINTLVNGSPERPMETFRRVTQPIPLVTNAVILVAEDNPVNQRVATLLLDELGFRSVVVENGKKAIEAVQDGGYSLVLMDCQMPELDGYEATRQIRKLETASGKHIPIVAMTAHAMADDRLKCIESGMDDYVAKPIERKHLRLVLTKWLLPTEISDSPRQSWTKLQAMQQVRAGTVKATSKRPVNLSVLENLCGKEEVGRILQIFISASETLFDGLKAAVDVADNRAANEITHQLKGSSASVGADEMSEMSKVLGDMCRKNNWPEAKEQLKELEISFARLKDYIHSVPLSG